MAGGTATPAAGATGVAEATAVRDNRSGQAGAGTFTGMFGFLLLLPEFTRCYGNLRAFSRNVRVFTGSCGYLQVFHGIYEIIRTFYGGSGNSRVVPCMCVCLREFTGHGRARSLLSCAFQEKKTSKQTHAGDIHGCSRMFTGVHGSRGSRYSEFTA
jgi:hypothetical protein